MKINRNRNKEEIQLLNQWCQERERERERERIQEKKKYIKNKNKTNSRKNKINNYKKMEGEEQIRLSPVFPQQKAEFSCFCSS